MGGGQGGLFQRASAPPGRAKNTMAVSSDDEEWIDVTSKSMVLTKAGFLNCFQMKNMCQLPSQPTGGLWKWKMVGQ